MIDLNELPEERAAELREAIELMYFGYRAFTAGPDRILEKRGLNRVHHRILYFIGRDSGQAVGQLLKTLDISKQALNKPLRQLIAMGLVSNEKSPTDGRIRELRLTREGSKLEAQLTATQQQQLHQVLSKSGTTAEQQWRAIMHALAG
jgi:DNA-binding MarR family transcriptional regulator